MTMVTCGLWSHLYYYIGCITKRIMFGKSIFLEINSVNNTLKWAAKIPAFVPKLGTWLLRIVCWKKYWRKRRMELLPYSSLFYVFMLSTFKFFILNCLYWNNILFLLIRKQSSLYLILKILKYQNQLVGAGRSLVLNLIPNELMQMLKDLYCSVQMFYFFTNFQPQVDWIVLSVNWSWMPSFDI